MVFGDTCSTGDGCGALNCWKLNAGFDAGVVEPKLSGDDPDLSADGAVNSVLGGAEGAEVTGL
jgi:hypothetical protein